MQKLPRQRRKVHFLEMEPRSTSSSPPAPNPPPLLLLKLIFLNLFPNHSLLFLSRRPQGQGSPSLSVSALYEAHQGPTAPPSPRPHDRSPGTGGTKKWSLSSSSSCYSCPGSRSRFCQEQVSLAATFLSSPTLSLDSLAPHAQVLGSCGCRCRCHHHHWLVPLG
jgi:hypothetical protein